MSDYHTLPITPQFALQEEPETQTHSVTFNTGDVQQWPRFHLPIRSWVLQWNVGTIDEAEKLKAFLLHHSGAETAFQWTRQANNPLPRPYLAPRISYKSGGSTGARTISVCYTWYDGSNETPRSYSYATLVLTAEVTIVVKTSPFPEHVTMARVYVGTSPSDMRRQWQSITDPDEGWTEPATGYDTWSVNPPTTNTFAETVLIYAIEDTLATGKIQYNAYRLSVKVKERIAA